MRDWPPPEEPPRKFGSMAAVGITVGAVLIVATCSTSRDRGVPPATPPLDALVKSAQPASPAPPPSENAAPPIPTEMPSAVASADPAPPPSGPLPRGPGHELDNFFAALRGLEKHTRKAHARVAWLGDSHGASDLWSGPLRSGLQARFGDGGPGFLHLGYKAYRHENVRLEVKGRWAPTPRQPSTAVRTGDGVFGLGGVLLAGSADGPFVTLTMTDPGLPPALSWDLCYKLGSPLDELRLSLTGAPDRTLKADGEASLGVLQHVTMASAGADPVLRVLPAGGQPNLCGVAVETDPKAQPGVVLDTLGINGARLTTPLAWDEASWVSELSRRPPVLVVLEYGTNESGDHTVNPERYAENLRRVMARVHAASPEADCLVLAPTDRADTEETTPKVRDALREAARASSCGFWDTYEKMGGKGSIVAWHAESPPRAGGDGVHLTPRGYKQLGEWLTADVMSGYRP